MQEYYPGLALVLPCLGKLHSYSILCSILQFPVLTILNSVLRPEIILNDEVHRD